MVEMQNILNISKTISEHIQLQMIHTAAKTLVIWTDAAQDRRAQTHKNSKMLTIFHISKITGCFLFF